MSTTKATPANVSSALRTMPAVICFDGDTLAHKAIAACQRYARVKYEDLASREAETIVIVSSERLLAQYQPLLRGSNIGIIALSDTRYRDARLDGAVYGYLPTNTPPSLVERMIDNALEHMHLLATRREVNERLAGATNEIKELNAIGAALSAEHDTDKLLEMILKKSREITKSDAGSLYLVVDAPLEGEAPAPAPEELKEYGGAKLVVSRKEVTRKVLRFKLAQNDTVAVPFREVVMDISDKSIAGYVVQTGEIVNLEDAYHLPELVPYSFNRKFDEDSGYRTKSMIAVPMRNPKDGEIVGVVQLINAKRNSEAKLNSLSAVVTQVVAYTVRQQEMVASLASQAAVALENSLLYQQQEKLFEGFAKAAVTAIELRDPTTAGHSERVMNLTVALAETVDRAADGPYKDLKFSRDQMKEIRYASLLHDVGKVSVSENVLRKAEKLYPDQPKLIKWKSQFLKRSLQWEVERNQRDAAEQRCEALENTLREIQQQAYENAAQLEALQSKAKFLLENGREEYVAKQAEFDAFIEQQLKEVDAYFATVLQANEPTLLPEGSFEKLTEIAARHFLDFDGADEQLLTPHEVQLLSIRKGSLDDNERVLIESHVTHTFEFLSKIPWTKEIRSIPEIARGHHEKLTGKGYPYRLAAPEIPLQTRMMTISDIFDALGASDRPYKKAVTLEKSLQILEMEVKDGNLDPNLFRLFVDAKIWERWHQEPFPY
ncbi:MAG: HD domain-containing phosphohydrolase [Terriglobales bacterium]|jgi:HD-GYP domain-containing protein (c-di-GMP phosphodiesterase class II)